VKKLKNEILRELIDNPQIPFSHISKKLKVSQNTVKKKYEEMVKEKVILNSSITIDLSKIGFQGSARFTITTEKKEETIEALKKIPNIILIAETFGDYNIVAIAIIKDYKSMLSIANEIWKMPPVKQVDVGLAQEAHFPLDAQFTKVGFCKHFI
jgi:Lrp/AsnC family transcriptional regulator, regulator for asnA, asnC and gidA